MVKKLDNHKQINYNGNANNQVDKSLIIAFLKLSPEQRINSNNKSLNTILGLQNAYRKSAKS
ncbi:hypothetical protein BVY03_04360 [bacterium K02(2017)]|nr:hypothetical protein BVY03_04360 [bacterium K02(2017)]